MSGVTAAQGVSAGVLPSIWSDGAALEGWTMAGRVGAGIAVPYVLPTSNDALIAFDVIYRGSPTDLSGSDNAGGAWIDVGGPIDGSNSSNINTIATNSEWVRYGKFRLANNGVGHASMQKYGTGVVRNFAMQMNGGNVLVGALTGADDTSTATLQVAGNFSSKLVYQQDLVVNQTATGASQGTGFAVSHAVTHFNTVAAGTGATLPVLSTNASNHYYVEIFNGGANALLVYPNTGQTILGQGANNSISVAVGKGIRLYALSSATWCYELSA